MPVVEHSVLDVSLKIFQQNVKIIKFTRLLGHVAVKPDGELCARNQIL